MVCQSRMLDCSNLWWMVLMRKDISHPGEAHTTATASFVVVMPSSKAHPMTEEDEGNLPAALIRHSPTMIELTPLPPTYFGKQTPCRTLPAASPMAVTSTSMASLILEDYEGKVTPLKLDMMPTLLPPLQFACLMSSLVRQTMRLSMTSKGIASHL